MVSGHREAGQDIIVVSASGHEVVDPIAALLGADTVIATQMVITDGRYTVDFAFYAYGEAKAVRIRQLAAERGYELADSYACSDSITDLPMLEAVGQSGPGAAAGRDPAGLAGAVLRVPARRPPGGRVIPPKSSPAHALNQQFSACEDVY